MEFERRTVEDPFNSLFEMLQHSDVALNLKHRKRLSILYLRCWRVKVMRDGAVVIKAFQFSI